MLHLRSVVPSDAYALWLWANDPAMRAAAGDRPVIGWSDHRAWMGRGGRWRYLLEVDNQPVGCVRFDAQAAGWRLSYVVAPEARGRGYGRVLVVQGLGHFKARPVYADVLAANTRSHRVFIGLGWAPEPTEGGVRYWCGHPKKSS